MPFKIGCPVLRFRQREDRSGCDRGPARLSNVVTVQISSSCSSQASCCKAIRIRTAAVWTFWSASRTRGFTVSAAAVPKVIRQPAASRTHLPVARTEKINQVRDRLLAFPLRELHHGFRSNRVIGFTSEKFAPVYLSGGSGDSRLSHSRVRIRQKCHCQAPDRFGHDVLSGVCHGPQSFENEIMIAAAERLGQQTRKHGLKFARSPLDQPDLQPYLKLVPQQREPYPRALSLRLQGAHGLQLKSAVQFLEPGFRGVGTECRSGNFAPG